LVTSDYVFDELITLLRVRVGHAEACAAGRALRGGGAVLVADVRAADIEAAWERFVRERDKRCSFTDCTSFAVMKRLGVKSAAAVDPDFRRAGFSVLP
jgi:predicted nucleic acid-binding protein